MPGKRNLARERAAHDATAAAQSAALYQLLRSTLPDKEHALIGRGAILRYLHDTLHLRRPNGGPLTWRIVLRWRRDAGFPLVRGGWNPRRRCLGMALATTHAVTAWTLTRFDTATCRGGFAVASPLAHRPFGKAPDESRPERIARQYQARRAA